MRIDNVDILEETLRTYERMQKRKGDLPTSLSKFRSRSASPYTPSLSKPARAVRAIHLGGVANSSESDISGSDLEEEQRRVYSATLAVKTTDRTIERPTKPRLGFHECD